jgi:predicted transcriptional regulator
MYTNCDEIFKITIPAVRVAVAKSLAKEHKMNQSDIAKQLGVAQAAVSKYLNSGYSLNISKIEKIIESKKLEKQIVKLIISKKDKEKVSQEIDRLASSGYLVKEALKTL